MFAVCIAIVLVFVCIFVLVLAIGSVEHALYRFSITFSKAGPLGSKIPLAT